MKNLNLSAVKITGGTRCDRDNQDPTKNAPLAPQAPSMSCVISNRAPHLSSASVSPTLLSCSSDSSFADTNTDADTDSDSTVSSPPSPFSTSTSASTNHIISIDNAVSVGTASTSSLDPCPNLDVDPQDLDDIMENGIDEFAAFLMNENLFDFAVDELA